MIGDLTMLNPGREALKGGGLSMTTPKSERRPRYTQRQRQLVRLDRKSIQTHITSNDGVLKSLGFSRMTLLNERKSNMTQPY